jgi:hypothetical protein
MSGDREWGLGLGTPRNEVLSNSHGDAIAPEIPMRGARGSRFMGVVAINSRSKRTGERIFARNYPVDRCSLISGHVI